MIDASLKRRGGLRPGDEEGQALVEAALVFPILLLLVIGVFEFGRAWNTHQVITDAAREGARIAVIADESVTEDSVRTVVEGALARAHLEPDSAVIQMIGVDGGMGEPATISIEYPYRFVFLTPLADWATAQGSITLSTAMVMRNE